MEKNEKLVEASIDQGRLIERLRATVRELCEGGMYASEVEEIVVRELLADD